MTRDTPRGIAVADLGSTNTKLALFSADGTLLAERKRPRQHNPGPPYPWIDPEPVMAFLAEAIPELDAILPIDVIVPCSHGACVACLDESGALALPIMDYTAEPPPDIVVDYRAIMPAFSEAFCGLLPMALIHALQLYWQQRHWPDQFARIATIMPYMQYAAYRLGGHATTEITSLSAQSHLMNVAQGGFSSLVKTRGWEGLFPPLVPAWEEVGTLDARFGGGALQGAGRIRAGLHDSSANFVRYLAGGFENFTLLSTGTWSISFNPQAKIEALDPSRDTCTNTSIFGKPVATSRFFGGKEFEMITGGDVDIAPQMAMVEQFVREGVFALPSFSASAGPMPGTEGRGRIIGCVGDARAARPSLASLYCALMVAEQLDAVESAGDIIVDGPFTGNPVLLGVLAQLRKPQRVFASTLRDGTTAGASCIGAMRGGALPHRALETKLIAPSEIPGLLDYQRQWKALAR